MKRLFSFMAGTVLGAAVGASLALLFTPYSGEELRELAREAAYAKREQLNARLRHLRSADGASSAPEEEL
jgi:gas vesicle protein